MHQKVDKNASIGRTIVKQLYYLCRAGCVFAVVDRTTQMLTNSDEIIRGWNARLSTNDYILVLIWISIRIQELLCGPPP